MASGSNALTPAGLAGHTVAIVGVGREGRAVAHMLQRDVPGATLLALDQSDGDAARAWRGRVDIPLHIVETTDGLPPGIDYAVVSPGFAPHNRLVQDLVAAGVTLTSGTDLFFSQYASQIIGVTGSKGKSTTSALIHHLLLAHGVDAALGGNVGVPLWDLDSADWFVAEISSFQASSLTHSPHTAVLTALFDEHRDWHGSFDNYARDKLTLVAHQPHFVVVNLTQTALVEQLETRHPGLDWVGVGPATHWEVRDVQGRDWLFGRGHKILPVDELPLPGRHNVWNVLSALAAVDTVTTLDTALAAEALRHFQPLPHRLEPISDPSGVVFLNDSLATNPPALAAALASLRDRRVIAIIGGSDRGVDNAALREEILAHPPAMLIGLPDSGPELLETIASWLAHAGVEHALWPARVPVKDMDDAVRVAREHASADTVVLLSPGAPSFGRYRDYQHRAEAFIAAIRDSAPTR